MIKKQTEENKLNMAKFNKIKSPKREKAENTDLFEHPEGSDRSNLGDNSQRVFISKDNNEENLKIEDLMRRKSKKIDLSKVVPE